MLTARIAVIASGGGTNLQALIDAQGRGELKSGSLTLVIADKAGIGAIGRAGKAGIPCAVIVRKEPEFEEKVLASLAEYNIDLVVLAGFLGIFSGGFIQKFHGPIINIHPALIPSFCGKGAYGLHVHEQALAYGVKVSGATVHFVNEECDGGPIILQKAVDVLPDDTPETLQRRIMEQCEWKLLPRAVSLFCQDRLRVEGRTVRILP